MLQLQFPVQLLRKRCDVYGKRDAFVIHGLTEMDSNGMECTCGVAFNSQIRMCLLDSAITWRGSNGSLKQAQKCDFRLSFTLDTHTSSYGDVKV